MTEYLTINDLINKNIYSLQFKPNRNIAEVKGYDYTFYLMYMEAVKKIFNFYEVGETECWQYIQGEKKLCYTEYHYGSHSWDENSRNALKTLNDMFTDIKKSFNIEYFGGNTAYVYIPTYYSKCEDNSLQEWLEEVN